MGGTRKLYNDFTMKSIYSYGKMYDWKEQIGIFRLCTYANDKKKFVLEGILNINFLYLNTILIRFVLMYLKENILIITIILIKSRDISGIVSYSVLYYYDTFQNEFFR